MHDGLWARIGAACALTMLLVGGLSVGLYNSLTHNYPGANDFYIPWRATQELFLEGRNPYSAEVTRDIQIVLFGAPRRPEEHQYAFAYPLPVSLLIAPLVRLPYDVAEAIWLSLCLTLLMLSIAALTLPATPRELLAFLAFGVFFYPAARSLILGQFAIFAWAMFTVGIVALRRGRGWDWLAGAALALSALKPQVPFLALPIIALWALQQRRYVLLASGIGLLGVLSALAMIALPSWPLDFLDSLRAYNSYVGLNSPTGILLGDTVLNDLVILVLVAALAVYALKEWRTGWPHFEELIFFSLIVSQLISPRTSTTNQIILLIPLLAWLKHMSNPQRLSVMLVLVVAPWAIFLATLRGNEEQPVAFLFVPFFCLAAASFILIRRNRQVTA